MLNADWLIDANFRRGNRAIEILATWSRLIKKTFINMIIYYIILYYIILYYIILYYTILYYIILYYI